MTRLPILLSIPHGGTKKPPELENYVCISDHDLFDDTDPFVVEIYDIGDLVQKVIKTDIARAFVDLNRSLQDLPPKNPDGLIKSMTCYQKPIYINGKEPDEILQKKLISLYYTPYHKQIQKALSDLELQLCLDCHSMATFAPNISPDGNKKKRPKFCISNQDNKTSSKEMLELLANCVAEEYEIDRNEISLNDPFKGGHITKTYGNNPYPWIQIEMSRELYLDPKWFDQKTLIIDQNRLKTLNKSFENMLKLFFKKLNF